MRFNRGLCFFILAFLGPTLLHATSLTLPLPIRAKGGDVRTFFLSSPNRYVVDYYGPRIKRPHVNGKSAYVTKTNQARHKRFYRWVFYVKPKTEMTKRWHKRKGYWDLELMFSNKGAAKKTKTVKSVPIAPAPSAPQKEKKPLRDLVIVIDPGHGGKDPGGVGKSIREKDVVLAVSKRLATKLRAIPGIRVVLTRERDRFVSLGRRQRISHAYHADLFVAIHADAYFHPKARGASVFALSSRGASSVAARWLAKRENRSLLQKDAAPSYRSRHVNDFLVDLQKTATIDSSMEMGQMLLDSFSKVTHLHHKKVERAGFAVLKSLDTPSVLVELGFVSNPTEARQLRTARYQNRLASAMERGIVKYLQKRNPHRFVKRREEKTVLVRKGDTLSGLAQKWHVSTKRLYQYNHLKSDRLRIGQSLRIPQA